MVDVVDKDKCQRPEKMTTPNHVIHHRRQGKVIMFCILTGIVQEEEEEEEEEEGAIKIDNSFKLKRS